jgi:putative endonuclease
VLFRKKQKLSADRNLLGKWGQKQTKKFLKKKGYKTLAENFSCKTGEIDLIMADSSGTVVFVEVKTRTNEDFADAEAAVTTAKKQRLLRTAKFFTKKYKLENLPLRFDVVIIIANQKNKPQIKHYENAF